MAPAAKKETTAVAVQDPKSSALAGIDDAMLDTMLDDAAQDKGMTAKDLTIPFLKIVQALTPERQRGDAKYIPGLEEGDILDTMTGKFWKGSEGVVLVPIRFMRSYTEWKPNRGGFVNDYGADESILKKCQKNERGRPALENGNEIQESMLYFVLVVDPTDGSFEQRVLALTSTQMKKARKWNSDMRSVLTTNPRTGRKFNPATYFYAYRMTTVPESKDKYNWMGVKLDFFGGSKDAAEVIKLPYGSGIYLEARRAEQDVVAGLVKVPAPAEDVVAEITDDAPGETAEPTEVSAAATDFEFPE